MRAKKLILFLTVLLLLVLVAACTTKMVTVSFYADGELCREVRVEKGKKIDYDEIPAVPEKPGYKGVWSDAALDDAVDSDLRIDAVYTINSYTVTFRADGKVVATRTVTMGKTVSDVPAVPEKAGYTGAWSISSESFASLNSDTVVDAVYTRNAVTVTFYKSTFTYNVARVTAGDNVEPNTYYVFTDDYVLTEDTVFVEGKSYFTRTRDYFAVMDAEDGVVVGNVPDPPAQDGYSVKWMKINPTPTGDILTTPDFNNVTESISVVAYPFITISLVDSFTGRSSFVAYDIGETVQSVRPLSATLTDYEFYSWYLDEDLKTPASRSPIRRHSSSLTIMSLPRA